MSFDIFSGGGDLIGKIVPSGSSSGGGPVELVMGAGALVGFVGGVMIGFQAGGVGGALLGAILGPIGVAFVAAFLWFALPYILGGGAILLLLWLIGQLWGVGR
ncbi:MAG: hypothetical protein JNM83_26715 [Myxococcales bacterium]|jgi:hypothetical protein|nr:hypothetical protein [Myxococcales bacterium]